MYNSQQVCQMWADDTFQTMCPKYHNYVPKLYKFHERIGYITPQNIQKTCGCDCVLSASEWSKMVTRNSTIEILFSALKCLKTYMKYHTNLSIIFGTINTFCKADSKLHSKHNKSLNLRINIEGMIMVLQNLKQRLSLHILSCHRWTSKIVLSSNI